MAHSLYRLVLVLALALTAQEVAAQAAPVVVPVAVQVTAPTASGGLQGIATYQATTGTGSAANTAYYSRAVAFSEQQVANAARARVAGPSAAVGAVAISAAILAAGYLLDAYTGQINSSPAVPPAPLGPQSWQLQMTPPVYFSTHSGAVGYTMNDGNTISAYCCSGNPATQATYYATPYGSATLLLVPTPAGAVNGATGVAAVPATDAQVAQAIRNNPNTWPELWTDPATGGVVNSQPVQDQATALRNELAAQAGIDPNTLPVPELSEAAENGQSDNQPTAWPSFCAWASKVCNFVDWMKQEPEDVDGDLPLPEKNIAATSGWTSGLGEGTCPPPIALTLSTGSYSLPLNAVCSFASQARTLILLFAALSAAYILAGAKSA
ncbi:virulence factor TspB C-terminal domain-related protein [Arenimonas oryziterrae]|uniref:Uncharacterized protein n=1 Tax=Arenimonas oryziterrae DSM 21050 = YC6267 TaxID=1121015 RepID=A0A091BCJ4_9GAMM|nr:virulence factor TspB C-terminal domain-related protein [Arenimonas oryziterrae]KFN42140.1 hypothetical protein N789_14655 [Arenimonas oryziterrae DSM 21050 = YC6267]